MRLTRVLVIGGGSIGERHLRCFLATRRAEMLLCEIDPGVRERLAAGHGLAGVFGEFEAALDSGPDAVVIATPAHLHIPMARQAAEHGCHLLVEKPLSTRLDGLHSLQSLVRASGLVARVAYVLRHYPMFAALKENMHEAALGEPLLLTVVSGQHFPAYRPAYRDIYYARHETGGGAIQDGLTHLLDAGSWWLGPVGRFAGDAGHLRLPGVEVEDSVNVLARHGKVMASYHYNQHQFPNETTVTMVCRNGTMRAEAHRSRFRVMRAPGEGWSDREWPDFGRDDAFLAQAHAFLDAVEGKPSDGCTLEEAEATLRWQLALLASAGEGDGWRRPSDLLDFRRDTGNEQR